MTKDRDFKRLVRERAARTGESYATARHNLRRPPDATDAIDAQLAHAAGHMTAEEAERLEVHINRHPADARGRARLLGYYFLHRPSNRQIRQQHVMWFVANAPRAGITGSPYCELDKVRDTAWPEAVALWLGHIEVASDDAALLANARDWFTHDDRELAIALAERVVGLTGTTKARLALAHILRLSSAGSVGNADETRAAARRVLDALGDRPEGGTEQPVWLQSAAWAALGAGELEWAREVADDLLALADSDFWYAGNAHHHGHLVRGHVALAGGDADAAATELRAAGATSGSPQLNSFGPNLSLAHALLECGRTTAVIAFLEDCRRFWAPAASEGEVQSKLASRHDQLINSWIRAIEEGATPNFGANLRYGT